MRHGLELTVTAQYGGWQSALVWAVCCAPYAIVEYWR